MSEAHPYPLPMAHLFKRPTPQAKGILVFTHKEIAFFTNHVKDIRFESVNRVKRKFFSVANVKRKYRADLARLRERYFLGVHFGHRFDDFPTLPYADFYMSGPGTVGFQHPEEVFLIPYNSRSFSSKIFTPDPAVPKRYDLLHVGRDIRLKNVDRILASVRKLYDQGKRYRVLLWILPARNRDEKRVYTTLAEDYYRLFSADERKDCVLMYLNRDLSIMGVAREELVHYYRQSKVFTLFTEKEGESRVISEALLCGLPVVVWDKLIGGGRDLLTPHNSVQFPSYDLAHEALSEAIDHHHRFDVANEALFRQTREDYVLPELKKYFTRLYAAHGQTYDGHLINTDDLADRLPGHSADVPWAGSRFATADVVSEAQWKILLAETL